MTDYTGISQNLILLIQITECAIQNIRCQFFWRTAHNIRNLSKKFTEFFSTSADSFPADVTSSILSALSELTDAQSHNNYVLLGDILEIKLLPALYAMQTDILSAHDIPYPDYFAQNLELLSCSNCTNKEYLLSVLSAWNHSSLESTDNYHIEMTNSGFLTLSKKYEDTFYYFHSNQNPMQEANYFVQAYADEDCLNYTIAGFGLNYHLLALQQKDARYRITVLESDIHVLGYAFRYIDLKPILTSGRIQIQYSPDFKDFGKYITSEHAKFIIHYPTLYTMPDGSVKTSLQNYFLQLSSMQEQQPMLKENFYYNQQLADSSVDAVRKDFENHEIVYLGGGPSTETKLPDIKNYIAAHPDVTTICAGKVYRVLLEHDFVPDYVIITDAKPSLIWQLQNIAETKTKLLYLSTASRTAVRAFHGSRYILYQTDFPDSEETAAIQHATLFETGGSVSTLAIDLALRFRCSSLIFTGLDLAYPEYKSHAFGISGNITSETAKLRAKGIDGDMLPTSPTFDAYRKWIENRISSVSGCPITNLTDGACIRGCFNKRNID